MVISRKRLSNLSFITYTPRLIITTFVAFLSVSKAELIEYDKKRQTKEVIHIIIYLRDTDLIELMFSLFLQQPHLSLLCRCLGNDVHHITTTHSLHQHELRERQ